MAVTLTTILEYKQQEVVAQEVAVLGGRERRVWLVHPRPVPLVGARVYHIETGRTTMGQGTVVPATMPKYRDHK